MDPGLCRGDLRLGVVDGGHGPPYGLLACGRGGNNCRIFEVFSAGIARLVFEIGTWVGKLGKSPIIFYFCKGLLLKGIWGSFFWGLGVFFGVEFLNGTGVANGGVWTDV